MCIVPPPGGRGKGARAPEPQDGSDGPDPRQGGRRRAAAGHTADEAALEPQRRDVAALLALRSFKSPDELPLGFSSASWFVGDSDRRALPRHENLILTPRERETIRNQIARVSACGNALIEVRRAEIVPSGVRESRMLVPATCGNRLCGPCDARRRSREAVRLEGQWRTFWTMGIPARVFSLAGSWRRVSRWVKAFFRELRRAVADSDQRAAVRISRSEVRRIAKWNRENPKRRPMPSLQYAWCVEPHVSGFPHVHWVTNARKINRNWVKRAWSKVIRARVRWVDVRPVKSIDGVCRYLAKYQAKTVFTPDIAAIMYRRRTWATTVPKPAKPTAEWEMMPRKEGESLREQTHVPEQWARAFGWKSEGASPGSFALWSREWDGVEWTRYRRNIFREFVNDQTRESADDYAIREMNESMADRLYADAQRAIVEENTQTDRVNPGAASGMVNLIALAVACIESDRTV